MVYQGSCHCDTVKFEISCRLNKSISCNCSICTKKGALHYRLPAAQFTLLEGGGALSLYQFETHTASHWFCRHCGVHPFGYPRIAPDQYSINIRCLDNFEQLLPNIEIIHFNGQNWEEAGKTLMSKESS